MAHFLHYFVLHLRGSWVQMGVGCYHDVAGIEGYETACVFETIHHQVLIRRLRRSKSQNIHEFLGKQGTANLYSAMIYMKS